MRASVVSLSLILPLLLVSTSFVVAGEPNPCTADFVKTITQTEYIVDHLIPVPSTVIYTPNYRNGQKYVVFDRLKLVDDPWLGPVLYLRITYCDKRSKQVIYSEEIYPGSTLSPGVGFQSIAYFAPYATLNCIVKSSLDSSNKLLFEKTLGSSESLLFKKVVSRHAQKIMGSKTISSNTRKSFVKHLESRNGGGADGGGFPEGRDFFATKACFAAIDLAA